MDVLNSLLDNLDEALIILDNKGKVLLFNEVAERLSRELFIETLQQGSWLTDSTNLETSLIIKDIIQIVRLKKTPEKYFTELKNTSGTIVSLEFHFVPVINDEGVETHIHLFIRDTTSQKVYEKKLTTQVANATSLIEKANAIIIGLDTRGYITDWNEHCVKITGFEKNDVYAKRFVDILMKDVKHEKFVWILENVLNGLPVVTEELLICTQKKGPITLLLSGTPRLSSSDEVVGLILVGQDVTELTEYRITLETKVEERTRELKRALQKEQKIVDMKTRFVSIASHEFRSPLSCIQFQTNFIRQNKEQITSNDLERRLNSIEKQTELMDTLLNDVLAYSKNEAYEIQLDLSQIVLMDFFNKITEDIRYYARKGTHSVKTDYTFIPLVITSDEKLLRSIVINLLTNAIKFSPGKESVYLTASDSGSQLVISIRDEGIGIPQDEINKIFEPFLRGKSVDAIQGTGLGLSIVKKSVELLNGTIHTKSEVGGGTTISITIPTRQSLN